MMPGMKHFFLRVITNSFVVPCTQCVKFCLSQLWNLRGLGQRGLLFLVAKRICSDGSEIVSGIFIWRVLQLVVALRRTRDVGRSRKIRHASKMSKANEKFSAKWPFLVEIDSLFLVSNRGGKGGGVDVF